jgi:hypothetical protein
MISKTENFRRFIFAGIIIIALGITLSNTLKSNDSFGIVLIAVGGLFFIVGMKKKKESEKEQNKS